jgi:hypothetical protein
VSALRALAECVDKMSFGRLKEWKDIDDIPHAKKGKSLMYGKET